MKIEDRIGYYATEARKRLDKLRLPENQMEFTNSDTDEDARRLKLYTEATTGCLYNTITAAAMALDAYRGGNWEAFADHHETMIGQSISARIPDLVSYMQKQKAKNKRSKDKEAARGIYKEHKPSSAKDLLKLLNDEGIDPPSKTVSNWLTEFSRTK